MNSIFIIIQSVLAVLVIAAVMLQNQGSGLGAAFGGSGTMFTTKRGVDLVLHKATIVLSILFFGIALLGHILA